MNNGRSVFIVGRRWFLRSIYSLPVLSLGGCQAAAPCPLCGGRLSTVGSHIDFRFLPSVNYDVWNRASDHVGCTGYEPWRETPGTTSSSQQVIDCAPEFDSYSPFCKQCFHAFSERGQRWVRSMDSPQSFVLPLSQEIQRFPLPAKSFISYSVVYQQSFGGSSGKDYYTDSINFWYKATAPSSTAADIDAYVHLHNMRFGLGLAKAPGEVYVSAIYAGSRPKLATA